jgi:polyphosphate kinase
VRSVVGRYLEHSRIFTFLNDGDPQVYIGSADLMHRNLDRRVEALVRLTDPTHLQRINDLLDLTMSEDTATWALGPDGTWTRNHRRQDGTPLRDLQNVIMQKIADMPPADRMRAEVRR